MRPQFRTSHCTDGLRIELHLPPNWHQTCAYWLLPRELIICKNCLDMCCSYHVALDVWYIWKILIQKPSQNQPAGQMKLKPDIQLILLDGWDCGIPTVNRRNKLWSFIVVTSFSNQPLLAKSHTKGLKWSTLDLYKNPKDTSSLNGTSHGPLCNSHNYYTGVYNYDIRICFYLAANPLYGDSSRLYVIGAVQW